MWNGDASGISTGTLSKKQPDRPYLRSWRVFPDGYPPGVRFFPGFSLFWTRPDTLAAVRMTTESSPKGLSVFFLINCT